MIKNREFTRREETQFYDKLNVLFNTSKCADSINDIKGTSFWKKCKDEFDDNLSEFIKFNKEDVIDEFKIDEDEFNILLNNVKSYE